MSLYFDLFINCDLREDIPDELIDVIKSFITPDVNLEAKPTLTIPKYGSIWNKIPDIQFLAPDPAHGVKSIFGQRYILSASEENNRDIYRYHLQYEGLVLHDDYFYAYHIPFVYWLATISHDKYLGYFIESGGDVMNHLVVEHGRLKEPPKY